MNRDRERLRDVSARRVAGAMNGIHKTLMDKFNHDHAVRASHPRRRRREEGVAAVVAVVVPAAAAAATISDDDER